MPTSGRRAVYTPGAEYAGLATLEARLPSSSELADRLAARGHAHLPYLLDAATCAELRALYAEGSRFRSRVVMERHGFGRGEYQYFAHPLPPVVAALRGLGYARLRPVAEAWHQALGLDGGFEARHADYLARCHAAGQTRPTPLLLRYGAGDENRLHQDLYGEHVFPLQIVVQLSAPGRDFEGGEFVLTEQRPRQQSRVIVPPLAQGDGLVFPVRFRPVPGRRGFYRATVRHGVAEVRQGERITLGIIFHDAR